MALPPLKGTGKPKSRTGTAESLQAQISNTATILRKTKDWDLNIAFEIMNE